MNFEFVETMTKQKIKLFGCFKRKNNNKCILYIPGISSNFFNCKLARILGENSVDNGYDFLFSHNQGSFQIMDYPVILENGEVKTTLKGSAYEKFEDCVYDIDAWLNYLYKFNYEEIVIVCHSLGCKKAIYYLNQIPNNKVSKIVMLAPKDSVNFSNLDIHKGLLEEAKNNIDLGEGEKLLSKKFLGFNLMSSETYYQHITNPVINNIPYETVNGDFSMLNNIEKPIYVLIGSKDLGENNEEYMKLITRNCINGKYTVIKDANHNFKNKEDELVSYILKYLND